MNTPQPTLLLDTNVWLDCYLPGRKGRESSCSLISFACKHGCPLFFAASSAKDVFYLVATAIKRDIREQKGTVDAVDAAVATETAWACVNAMRENALAVGSDESDLWLACKLRSVHDDLEDDLVVAAAQRAHATYLITSDELLVKHAPVAALSPADVLALLQSTL